MEDDRCVADDGAGGIGHGSGDGSGGLGEGLTCRAEEDDGCAERKSQRGGDGEPVGTGAERNQGASKRLFGA